MHMLLSFARGAASISANKVSSFWRIMLRVEPFFGVHKDARKPAIFLLRMDLAGRPVF